MTPQQYCQNKAAQSGSSFYYSFLFLPAERRRAILALYAFCREIDDTVDETKDPQIAATKLDWWRQEVIQTFAHLENTENSRPQHPVCQELLVAISAFQLEANHFIEIIEGMAMDLKQNRYSDFSALQLYCYRVASLVGLMAARIFGYQNPQTIEYAHDLGIALQLTNIIRDLGEDARRDRIYLPLDELQRFGVSPATILQRTPSDRLKELLLFQIERAQSWFNQAYSKLPAVDRDKQRPGLIMAKIYKTLLHEISKDPCIVLDRRVALTPIRKLWLAWRT